MLQVLSQIILSILCVYGGYRLLHDLADLLERRLKIRRDRISEMQSAAQNEDKNDRKGGEDPDRNGK